MTLPTDQAAYYIEKMTAAVFLVTVGLLALHIALGAEAMLLRLRIGIAVASLSALPLAFGPFVPISHFIFEASSRAMLMAMQALAVLLLVSLIWRLATRWLIGTSSDFKVLYAGNLISHTIWLGTSIWLSDYERETTPEVWDAPIYILDWLAALAACSFLAIAAWRIPESGLIFRFLVTSYLVLLVTMAYVTLS